MHRSAEHGLRVDDEGLTLDPDVVDDRLHRLVHWTGTASVDAAYAAVLADYLDPEEMEHARRWRRAYLGRYMRQPMSEFDDMPLDEIRAYVEIVSDFLRVEAGKPAEHTGISAATSVTRTEADFT